MDQDQMAAWMKYANPGEKHDYLKKLEGKWTGKAKFWMQPGAPPTESEGTAVNTLILGGRFLQSSYTSEVMGQPFEGFGLDGYDIHKQKYIGLWSDTMTTKMLVFEGTCDGKVREMFSEFDDPMTDKPTQMKGLTTIISDNEHKYEGWNLGPDGEFRKSMEVVYTRQ